MYYIEYLVELDINSVSAGIKSALKIAYLENYSFKIMIISALFTR